MSEQTQQKDHHLNNTCHENWHSAADHNEPTLESHCTFCLFLSADTCCYGDRHC